MNIVDDFNEIPPFEIIAPAAQSAPFVFNSPHSGRTYPRSFLHSSRLDHQTIRRSEDTYVDELFEIVAEAGAPLLRANFPRAYLDVNREPYELDPTMFNGKLPGFANSSSPRVAGGLGTIARVVADAAEIYREPLPVAEGLSRIERLYKPYHMALAELLVETQNRFGYAILIDCHSMPSSARGVDGRIKPEIIIGDRYATSCARCLSDRAVHLLAETGYKVGRNRPYAGGYITERYGRPGQGIHALQIELNRALYMDEATYEKTPNFAKLADDVARFACRLLAAPPASFGVSALAAE